MSYATTGLKILGLYKLRLNIAVIYDSACLKNQQITQIVSVLLI